MFEIRHITREQFDDLYQKLNRFDLKKDYLVIRGGTLCIKERSLWNQIIPPFQKPDNERIQNVAKFAFRFFSHHAEYLLAKSEFLQKFQPIFEKGGCPEKYEHLIQRIKKTVDAIPAALDYSFENLQSNDLCINRELIDFDPLHNFPFFLHYCKAMERYFDALQELTRSAPVQLSNEMIQEQIHSAASLMDGVANVIKKMDKKFSYCNHCLQLIDCYIKLQGQIDSIRKSKEFALKILNPIHFHRDCNSLRATFLLSHQPPGTYLIRPGSEAGLIEMDYVCSSNGNEVLSVQVVIGSKNEVKYQDRELSLEELVLELSQAHARPLPHQQMDHLTAQFEWNLTDQSPEDLLEHGQKNCFCITRAQSGNYILHTSGHSGIASYTISIYENSVQATQNGSKKTLYTAKSLHQLLSDLSEGQNYSIKGQITYPIFDALFYQSLLQQMQESKQEWIKVSRRLHHWLPYSVIANVNGEFYAQIHKTIFDSKKGFRGSGAYKYVWDLKSINHQKKLVRVKIRDRINLKSSYSAIAKMKERIPIEKQDLLLLPTYFSYQKPDAQTVNLQVMPSMIGDLFTIWESLPLKGRMNTALQVAEALEAMHDAGIAHLDVKLENIMIESLRDVNHPKVRLGDFDFSQTPTSIIKCGTIGYIDPNINLSKVSDLEGAKIADQFSFGILLSYLATDFSPRSDDDVTHGRPIMLHLLYGSDYWSSVHPIIQDIMRDCLEGLDRTYKLKDVIRRLRIYIEMFG